MYVIYIVKLQDVNRATEQSARSFSIRIICFKQHDVVTVRGPQKRHE